MSFGTRALGERVRKHAHPICHENRPTKPSNKQPSKSLTLSVTVHEITAQNSAVGPFYGQKRGLGGGGMS